MTYEDYDPDDPDAPQPGDLDGDEDEDEIVCSNCGRVLHADAAVCPACGEWVIDDSPASQRSRTWFWPFCIVLLIGLILAVWSRFR